MRLPVSTSWSPTTCRIVTSLSRKLPTYRYFPSSLNTRPSGKPAHLDFVGPRHLLAVDLQRHDRSVAVVEERVLVGVRAAQDHRHRHLAVGTDRKALGPVADDDLVDHARRHGLEIDHGDRVDVAVGGARQAVVRGEQQLAVRRDVEVVRPPADRDVLLVVGDLVAVDREQRSLVAGKFRRHRALAVGRDRDVRHLLAHRTRCRSASPTCPRS